jgi:hypothetical protein
MTTVQYFRHAARARPGRLAPIKVGPVFDYAVILGNGKQMISGAIAV